MNEQNKKDNLINFLDDLHDECFLNGEPSSMLSAYQSAVQALEAVKTKLDMAIADIKSGESKLV